jgi:hypothetical protein
MRIPEQRADATFVCILVILVLASGCGSPTTPTRPPSTPPVDTPPPPPPPPTPNKAPIISSLTLSSPRVEADQEVVATAIVEDDVTPIDQLTYEWSARPVNGTFTGSGRQVRWRAPHLQTTPDTYTLTLMVTEKYTEIGVAKENKTTATVQLHYNDSYADISKLSLDFLNDFATYSMSPEQCVRNFSDSCRGKADELNDIRANRTNFQIQSARLGTPAVLFDANMTFANSDVPCTFVSIQKTTGKTETATGTCLLTGVYENFKWFLCDSNFRGSATTISARGLHP